MSYDYLFKLIVIGNAYVGKTSIVSSLINRPLTNDYQNTIGVDFSSKHLVLDNQKKIKIQMWDTAGQESFHSIIKGYYRYVAGVVLVFDVTDRSSFEKIDDWLYQYRKENECYNQKEDCKHEHPILLLGNKCDKEHYQRLVSREEAETKAKEIGAIYYETSAYTRFNIEEAFMQLSEEIYEKMIRKLTIPFCKGIRCGPVKQFENKYHQSRGVCFYDNETNTLTYGPYQCCSII